MKSTKEWCSQFISLVKKHKLTAGILFGCFILVFGFVMVSYLYVGSYSKYIISDSHAKQLPNLEIGIVFGSGITKDGKPYKELQGRLDKAADALKNGEVVNLLLTGDNRYKNYDEPTAMKKYLVDVRHVDPDLLILDFAGRSTYESCERADKIFRVGDAILFSAPSHLPRAIFTCRKFGIESYGMPAGADANNAFRREFLARAKAMFNIYILGEKTILGKPMPIFNPL